MSRLFISHTDHLEDRSSSIPSSSSYRMYLCGSVGTALYPFVYPRKNGVAVIFNEKGRSPASHSPVENWKERNAIEPIRSRSACQFKNRRRPVNALNREADRFRISLWIKVAHAHRPGGNSFQFTNRVNSVSFNHKHDCFLRSPRLMHNSF